MGSASLFRALRRGAQGGTMPQTGFFKSGDRDHHPQPSMFPPICGAERSGDRRPTPQHRLPVMDSGVWDLHARERTMYTKPPMLSALSHHAYQSQLRRDRGIESGAWKNPYGRRSETLPKPLMKRCMSDSILESRVLDAPFDTTRTDLRFNNARQAHAGFVTGRVPRMLEFPRDTASRIHGVRVRRRGVL